MYDDEDDTPECPLCLDPLEFDDVSFFPCTCGYQVCRFCWHRIRTDENGLCPQCRKPYSEDPVRFKPLSNEEIQKLKKDRDRRAKEKKGNALDSRKHLANLRVVQPNLLFVVGLTQRMADAEVLKRSENFGRFGKINKLSVTVTSPSSTASTNGSATSSSNSQPSRFSATCHVTYAKAEDALRALLFLDQSQLDSRTLRISIGTTKYCSNFVKGNTCHRKDCTYLHEVGPSDASFTKEAMQDGKHVEYERRLLLEFVARNPSLAQQVDISKISNKTLPAQQGNNNNNHNNADSSGGSSQVQSLLNGGESGPRNLQSAQMNGSGKNGPQIGSSKSQAHQPRSSAALAAGHSNRKSAHTAIRNRSGSASGKHRSVQGKPASKSKDDASIVSTSSHSTNHHRGSRSNKNGAAQAAKSSLVSKSTDIASAQANSSGVRASSSTSSVAKPAAPRSSTVRTSRLTTPDEPVWWGLDSGAPEELVSSSSASASPTNGKLSPSHPTIETASGAPQSSAPSPLLAQGADSGFVSSSSSTGGSEPSSIGLQNSNANGTLIALFSTAPTNGTEPMLFGPSSSAAASLASSDKAIAAILSPSPDRSASQAPVGLHSTEMQPGQPIDLQDILRSCANVPLPASSGAQHMNSSNSDCCDDLDVDPMEESIRRLNDLMVAEQRKKAVQPSEPSYSLFSQQDALAKSMTCPPTMPLPNGFHGRANQPPQQFHPQMSSYPSISSSSLFASFQQQQHVSLPVTTSSNGASHHAPYNANGASWPTYSANGYGNASYAQQQRSFGAVGGFGGSSSSSASSNNVGDSPNLAHWLLQPSMQQQQNPAMANCNYVSSQQQQSLSNATYGLQQSSSQMAPVNDYMATVFAAPGKVF